MALTVEGRGVLDTQQEIIHATTHHEKQEDAELETRVEQAREHYRLREIVLVVEMARLIPRHKSNVEYLSTEGVWPTDQWEANADNVHGPRLTRSTNQQRVCG